jgi:hypothetical protein
VENLSFQELPPREAVLPPGKTEYWRKLLQPWAWALRYVALATLFLVVYGLILRPVKKQALAAFRQIPVKLSSTAPQVAGAPGQRGTPPLVEAGDSTRSASQLKRMLTEKVKAEPESASRLVQSWVRKEQD